MSKYPPPSASRVLVIAPHPDDETLGCGGAIALYSSGGAEVRVVFVTDGEGIAGALALDAAETARIRRAETEEASKALGVNGTYHFGLPDGGLAGREDEIKGKLTGILEEFEPDILYSPSPLDYHDDHLAVARTALRVSRTYGLRVAFYEVYSTVRFNTIVDVSDVMEVKERAIMCYSTSLLRRPEFFAGAMRGLGSFRSFYTLEPRLCEAFWLLSAPISDGEAFEWLTYGQKAADPAEAFVSKLRAVDGLLNEVKAIEDAHNACRADLERYAADAETLKSRLELVERSFIWRCALRFYGTRDRILPEGSIRRGLYNRVVSIFKR